MSVLETERLILRRPKAEDADEYMEFRNSDFVLRYNAMTSTTRESVLERFARPEEHGRTFLLEHRETKRVIGAVFTEEDSLRWGVNSKEVSYFMNQAFARQGYMKEALGAVVRCLFEEEKLDCVAARSFAPNAASRRLLLSLGFHQDGMIPRCVKGWGDVIYDDALYSLIRDEGIRINL